MAAGQTRRIRLDRLVGRHWPGWDPETVASSIAEGRIVVDGTVISNPAALVRLSASVRAEAPIDLAGRRKLAWAISRFGVGAEGQVALDVGASTGGFTLAWLEAGAGRVYAVDVGHGQLLGSLRQDRRVVNLERTNVADLGGGVAGGVVPEPVSLVSVDVSYLSLGSAVAQVPGTIVAVGAELLGLVKPMFELRLPTIPSDRNTLEQARDRGVDAVRDAGWAVEGVDECPVRGGRGAVEFFVHARWPG